MNKSRNKDQGKKGDARWVEQLQLKKERELLLDDYRTPLIRRISPNLDQIMIVTSIKEPEFNPGLVDRFLVLASIENLKAFICISKIDLVTKSEGNNDIEKWSDIYRKIGVPVILTSSVKGEGIEEIKEMLEGKLTALAGHSGVGKSTLLNSINSLLRIETDSVNLITGKGRHITKSVKIYTINDNTKVIDLPGIKLIDFPDLKPVDVARKFADFSEFEDECKFADCAHLKEPDCGVRDAVDRGDISLIRYESYLRISEELQK
jgi:ribosome biogenesis GTPase